MTTKTEPRVWVGCLACYNAGDLVGAWVDATEAGEYVPCHRSDFGSPHEEWWVMDHEGFGGMLTGECSPVEAQAMAEVLARVEEETGGESDAFAAYVGHIGRDDAASDWDAAVDGFQDAYCGMWSSEKDYAQNLAEETAPRFYTESTYGTHVETDVSEVWPWSYIDWDRATDSLFNGDYWSEATGTGDVFVFNAELTAHTVGPDPFGLPHAWCKS